MKYRLNFAMMHTDFIEVEAKNRIEAIDKCSFIKIEEKNIESTGDWELMEVEQIEEEYRIGTSYNMEII